MKAVGNETEPVAARAPHANETESRQNCLDSSRDRRPHQARRRANGGAALEPRSEAPCPADDELDPGTKAMCDLLVDMAFRKLLKQAGAATVAKER